MKDFYDFFIKELKDVYSAEQQLVRALPEMAKAAKAPQLQEAFLEHLGETKEQVDRLEQISKILGKDLKGQECKAMQGLIDEGQEVLKTAFEEDTQDAALISAAQRIEHYEIAAYGSLQTYAKHLELKEVAQLLHETLKEESHADKKLTTLAEGGLFKSGINKKACQHCHCH